MAYIKEQLQLLGERIPEWKFTGNEPELDENGKQVIDAITHRPVFKKGTKMKRDELINILFNRLGI
jgi:hypothetical protein